jgi:hypothetical protein
MDDSFNMDDFSIEHDYRPVPAYDVMRFEMIIMPDLTIEIRVVQPDYLAITREVVEG